MSIYAPPCNPQVYQAGAGNQGAGLYLQLVYNTPEHVGVITACCEAVVKQSAENTGSVGDGVELDAQAVLLESVTKPLIPSHPSPIHSNTEGS